KEIVITFDDGYRNNYTIVAPYLKSKNIPFTVFICTELIEKSLKVPTFYVRAAIYSNILLNLNIPSINKNYKLNTLENQNLANKELVEIIKTVPKNEVDKILFDIKSNFTSEQFELLNLNF